MCAKSREVEVGDLPVDANLLLLTRVRLPIVVVVGPGADSECDCPAGGLQRDDDQVTGLNLGHEWTELAEEVGSTSWGLFRPPIGNCCAKPIDGHWLWRLGELVPPDDRYPVG